MKDPHIIRKQVIAVRISRQNEAFAIQHDMSSFYARVVLPLMEKAFDNAMINGENIQIDKFEIDLGIIRLDEIRNHVLNNDTREKLISQLNEKLKDAQRANIAGSGRPLPFADKWLFFLKNGYLGWDTLSGEAFNENKILETFAADYESVSMLRRLIKADLRARSRIVLQYGPVFLRKLVEIFTARKQEVLDVLVPAMLELLERLNKRGLEKMTIQHRKRGDWLWEELILYAASGIENSSASKLIIESIQGHFSFYGADKMGIESLLRTDPDFSPADLRLLDTVSNERKPEELHDLDPERPISEEEGIYADHAGLVILHPFLFSFLERVQLFRDGAFPDRFSHQKAVHLMYYLATGNQQPGEWELVIPKLMTGYLLKDIIERNIELSTEEMETADHLLEVVISKWTALKNTGVEALRDGFLQRKGKFHSQDDRNFLQVERGAIDILLEQLPWSLSYIKLPWMKKLLEVQWV